MGLIGAKLLGVGSFGEPLGTHSVGTATCRFPSGCHARIFYPAATSGGEPYPYMRKVAIECLARHLGQPAWLLALWRYLDHPYRQSAQMLRLQQMPVVVFSHGLLGNSEMYSKLCGDLASFGVLVVACEHEDGSGSFALPEGATEPVLYKEVPDDLNYERDKVVEFRRPFLEHRSKELHTIVNWFSDLKESSQSFQREQSEAAVELDEVVVEEGSNLSVLEEMSKLDLGKLWLAGHSFGSASIVQATQRNASIRERVAGALLFDLWPYPLSEEESVGRGLVVPTLIVLTSQFRTNDEYPITERLIECTSANVPVRSFYIPATKHQQMSDVPWLMSRWLARLVHGLGSTSKEASQSAIVRAATELILGGSIAKDGDTAWEALVQSEHILVGSHPPTTS